jgi:hypothetical protein
MPLAPYDVVLDADGRWCVVLEVGGDGTLAYCPTLDRRVQVEAPVQVHLDPLPFLRVQPTSRLVVALFAWHAVGAASGSERIGAELRAILGAAGRSKE